MKVVIARQLAVNTDQYLRDLFLTHLRPQPESGQSLSGRRLGRLGPRWTADWAASELDSLLILFCLSKALIVVKTENIETVLSWRKRGWRVNYR